MGNVKNKGGRPTVMTPETVKKLEDAFIIGCTDEEACFYANISKPTLYDYIKLHPEFSDRKEALKKSPSFKAKKNIVNALEEGDKETSKWYLERKNKDEFSTKTESVNQSTTVQTVYIEKADKKELEEHISDIVDE